MPFLSIRKEVDRAGSKACLTTGKKVAVIPVV
jgi:hypothetical protein